METGNERDAATPGAEPAGVEPAGAVTSGAEPASAATPGYQLPQGFPPPSPSVSPATVSPDPALNYPPPSPSVSYAPPSYAPPPKKPLYKRVWFWLIIAVVLVLGVVATVALWVLGSNETKAVKTDPVTVEVDTPADAKAPNQAKYSLTKKESYESLVFYVDEKWSREFDQDNNTTYFINVTTTFVFQQSIKLPELVSRDNFMEGYKDIFFEQEGMTIISSKDVQIGGKDARRIDSKIKIGDISYHTVTFLVVVDDRTIAPFLFLCPISAYDTYQDLIDDFTAKITIDESAQIKTVNLPRLPRQEGIAGVPKDTFSCNTDLVR